MDIEAIRQKMIKYFKEATPEEILWIYEGMELGLREGIDLLDPRDRPEFSEDSNSMTWSSEYPAPAVMPTNQEEAIRWYKGDNGDLISFDTLSVTDPGKVSIERIVFEPQDPISSNAGFQFDGSSITERPEEYRTPSIEEFPTEPIPWPDYFEVEFFIPIRH